MKRKFLLNLVFVVFVLCLFSKFTYADGVGTDWADFLKIDILPRPTAMAGAFVGICDDIGSLSYNPAGLPLLLNKHDFSFQHTEYLADIDEEYAAGAVRIGNFGYGINYRYLHTSMPEVNIVGEEIGTIPANFTSYAFGIGYLWKEFLSFGVNLKGIQSQLAADNDYALALDIGAIYLFNIKNIPFRAGLSLLNLSTGITSQGIKETKLPTLIKTGIAYYNPKFLNISMELDIPMFIPKFQLGVGAEYYITPAFVLRGGWKFLHDTVGPSCGLGYVLRTKELDYTFDYALSSMGALGLTHRFGISIKSVDLESPFLTKPAKEVKKEETKEETKVIEEKKEETKVQVEEEPLKETQSITETEEMEKKLKELKEQERIKKENEEKKISLTKEIEQLGSEKEEIDKSTELSEIEKLERKLEITKKIEQLKKEIQEIQEIQ